MAVSDGHVSEGGAVLRSIFGFGGGFAGSDEAYDELLEAYHQRTGRETHFAPSLREGRPITPLWGDPEVEPFVFQAAHFADQIGAIIERSDEPIELHLGAHSFGVPVVLFYAVQLLTGQLYPPAIQKRVQLMSFTGLCPGGVYEEPTLLLEGRIATMALHDIFTSEEGREYWWNAREYIFGNVKRSLREGACIAGNPVTPDLCAVLRAAGVLTKMFLAPDDNAFSYGKTRRELEMVVPCFELERGTGHNPQFNPAGTLDTLHRNGALYA